jgi:hypothetical protein
MSISHIPGARRVGNCWVLKAPPKDPLCLRCSVDVDDDEAIPYYTPCMDNGTEYVLCFDCSPAEWRAEIIEFEQGLDEDERYLPWFLLA